MYEAPTVLQTAADYELIHQMALDDECPTDKPLTHWHGLLDGRSQYEFDRVLTAQEAPDGSEPEYRVIEAEDDDGTGTVRTQFRLVEQSDARIFRLGYTVAEVEAKINELEAH